MAKGTYKKHKKNPKYSHNRSSGMSHRNNKGTVYQPIKLSEIK